MVTGHELPVQNELTKIDELFTSIAKTFAPLLDNSAANDLPKAKGLTLGALEKALALQAKLLNNLPHNPDYEEQIQLLELQHQLLKQKVNLATQQQQVNQIQVPELDFADILNQRNTIRDLEQQLTTLATRARASSMDDEEQAAEGDIDSPRRERTETIFFNDLTGLINSLLSNSSEPLPADLSAKLSSYSLDDLDNFLTRAQQGDFSSIENNFVRSRSESDGDKSDEGYSPRSRASSSESEYGDTRSRGSSANSQPGDISEESSVKDKAAQFLETYKALCEIVAEATPWQPSVQNIQDKKAPQIIVGTRSPSKTDTHPREASDPKSFSKPPVAPTTPRRIEVTTSPLNFAANKTTDTHQLIGVCLQQLREVNKLITTNQYRLPHLLEYHQHKDEWRKCANIVAQEFPFILDKTGSYDYKQTIASLDTLISTRNKRYNEYKTPYMAATTSPVDGIALQTQFIKDYLADPFTDKNDDSRSITFPKAEANFRQKTAKLESVRLLLNTLEDQHLELERLAKPFVELQKNEAQLAEELSSLEQAKQTIQKAQQSALDAVEVQIVSLQAGKDKLSNKEKKHIAKLGKIFKTAKDRHDEFIASIISTSETVNLKSPHKNTAQLETRGRAISTAIQKLDKNIAADKYTPPQTPSSPKNSRVNSTSFAKKLTFDEPPSPSSKLQKRFSQASHVLLSPKGKRHASKSQQELAYLDELDKKSTETLAILTQTFNELKEAKLSLLDKQAAIKQNKQRLEQSVSELHNIHALQDQLQHLIEDNYSVEKSYENELQTITSILESQERRYNEAVTEYKTLQQRNPEEQTVITIFANEIKNFQEAIKECERLIYKQKLEVKRADNELIELKKAREEKDTLLESTKNKLDISFAENTLTALEQRNDISANDKLTLKNIITKRDEISTAIKAKKTFKSELQNKLEPIERDLLGHKQGLESAEENIEPYKASADREIDLQSIIPKLEADIAENKKTKAQIEKFIENKQFIAKQKEELPKLEAETVALPTAISLLEAKIDELYAQQNQVLAALATDIDLMRVKHLETASHKERKRLKDLTRSLKHFEKRVKVTNSEIDKEIFGKDAAVSTPAPTRKAKELSSEDNSHLAAQSHADSTPIVVPLAQEPTTPKRERNISFTEQPQTPTSAASSPSTTTSAWLSTSPSGTDVERKQLLVRNLSTQIPRDMSWLLPTDITENDHYSDDDRMEEDTLSYIGAMVARTASGTSTVAPYKGSDDEDNEDFEEDEDDADFLASNRSLSQAQKERYQSFQRDLGVSDVSLFAEQPGPNLAKTSNSIASDQPASAKKIPANLQAPTTPHTSKQKKSTPSLLSQLSPTKLATKASRIIFGKAEETAPSAASNAPQQERPPSTTLTKTAPPISRDSLSSPGSSAVIPPASEQQEKNVTFMQDLLGISPLSPEDKQLLINARGFLIDLMRIGNNYHFEYEFAPKISDLDQQVSNDLQIVFNNTVNETIHALRQTATNTSYLKEHCEKALLLLILKSYNAAKQPDNAFLKEYTKQLLSLKHLTDSDLLPTFIAQLESLSIQDAPQTISAFEQTDVNEPLHRIFFSDDFGQQAGAQAVIELRSAVRILDPKMDVGNDGTKSQNTFSIILRPAEADLSRRIAFEYTLAGPKLKREQSDLNVLIAQLGLEDEATVPYTFDPNTSLFTAGSVKVTGTLASATDNYKELKKQQNKKLKAGALKVPEQQRYKEIAKNHKPSKKEKAIEQNLKSLLVHPPAETRPVLVVKDEEFSSSASQPTTPSWQVAQPTRNDVVNTLRNFLTPEIARRKTIDPLFDAETAQQNLERILSSPDLLVIEEENANSGFESDMVADPDAANTAALAQVSATADMTQQSTRARAFTLEQIQDADAEFKSHLLAALDDITIPDLPWANYPDEAKPRSAIFIIEAARRNNQSANVFARPRDTAERNPAIPQSNDISVKVGNKLNRAIPTSYEDEEELFSDGPSAAIQAQLRSRIATSADPSKVPNAAMESSVESDDEVSFELLVPKPSNEHPSSEPYQEDEPTERSRASAISESPSKHLKVLRKLQQNGANITNQDIQNFLTSPVRKPSQTKARSLEESQQESLPAVAKHPQAGEKARAKPSEEQWNALGAALADETSDDTGYDFNHHSWERVKKYSADTSTSAQAITSADKPNQEQNETASDRDISSEESQNEKVKKKQSRIAQVGKGFANVVNNLFGDGAIEKTSDIKESRRKKEKESKKDKARQTDAFRREEAAAKLTMVEGSAPYAPLSSTNIEDKQPQLGSNAEISKEQPATSEFGSEEEIQQFLQSVAQVTSAEELSRIHRSIIANANASPDTEQTQVLSRARALTQISDTLRQFSKSDQPIDAAILTQELNRIITEDSHVDKTENSFDNIKPTDSNEHFARQHAATVVLAPNDPKIAAIYASVRAAIASSQPVTRTTSATNAAEFKAATNETEFLGAPEGESPSEHESFATLSRDDIAAHGSSSLDQTIIDDTALRTILVETANAIDEYVVEEFDLTGNADDHPTLSFSEEPEEEPSNATDITVINNRNIDPQALYEQQMAIHDAGINPSTVANTNRDLAHEEASATSSQITADLNDRNIESEEATDSNAKKTSKNKKENALTRLVSRISSTAAKLRKKDAPTKDDEISQQKNVEPVIVQQRETNIDGFPTSVKEINASNAHENDTSSSSTTPARSAINPHPLAEYVPREHVALEDTPLSIANKKPKQVQFADTKPSISSAHSSDSSSLATEKSRQAKRENGEEASGSDQQASPSKKANRELEKHHDAKLRVKHPNAIVVASTTSDITRSVEADRELEEDSAVGTQLSPAPQTMVVKPSTSASPNSPSQIVSPPPIPGRTPPKPPAKRSDSTAASIPVHPIIATASMNRSVTAVVEHPEGGMRDSLSNAHLVSDSSVLSSEEQQFTNPPPQERNWAQEIFSGIPTSANHSPQSELASLNDNPVTYPQHAAIESYESKVESSENPFAGNFDHSAIGKKSPPPSASWFGSAGDKNIKPEEIELSDRSATSSTDNTAEIAPSTREVAGDVHGKLKKPAKSVGSKEQSLNLIDKGKGLLKSWFSNKDSEKKAAKKKQPEPMAKQISSPLNDSSDRELVVKDDSGDSSSSSTGVLEANIAHKQTALEAQPSDTSLTNSMKQSNSKPNRTPPKPGTKIANAASEAMTAAPTQVRGPAPIPPPKPRVLNDSSSSNNAEVQQIRDALHPISQTNPDHKLFDVFHDSHEPVVTASLKNPPLTSANWLEENLETWSKSTQNDIARAYEPISACKNPTYRAHFEKDEQHTGEFIVNTNDCFVQARGTNCKEPVYVEMLSVLTGNTSEKYTPVHPPLILVRVKDHMQAPRIAEIFATVIAQGCVPCVKREAQITLREVFNHLKPDHQKLIIGMAKHLIDSEHDYFRKEWERTSREKDPMPIAAIDSVSSLHT